MSFLFFFASLVSAAVAAEAVRRHRNVREATKVGVVLFAVLSLCGSAWMGTDAAVGCAAAAPIFALAVLAAVLLRNSAELLLQRLVGRWKQSVQAPEQVWRVQPVVMHG